MGLEDEYQVCKLAVGKNDVCFVFSDKEVALYFFSPEVGYVINKKFSLADNNIFKEVQAEMLRIGDGKEPEYDIFILEEGKKPVYIMPVNSYGTEGDYGIDVRLGENGEIETSMVKVMTREREVDINNNRDKNDPSSRGILSPWYNDFIEKQVEKQIQKPMDRHMETQRSLERDL